MRPLCLATFFATNSSFARVCGKQLAVVSRNSLLSWYFLFALRAFSFLRLFISIWIHLHCPYDYMLLYGAFHVVRLA
jgi:hypothetical protein